MTKKTPTNQNKEWTKPNIVEMKKLIKSNTPTRIMGLKLGRSPEAVQQEANKLGLSTKPVNQSPYGKAKK